MLNTHLRQTYKQTAIGRSRFVKGKFVLSSDDIASLLWHDKDVKMNEQLTSETRKEERERTVRVLIADDQRPTRRALASVLAFSLQPIKVVGEAADGEDAVRLAAELRPDVVIMDLQMPRMDGLEATRRIKSQWPEVRIVVLTIYPGYRAEASAAGADAFLLKGCPVDTLQAAITPEPNSNNCRHADRMRGELANNQLIRKGNNE